MSTPPATIVGFGSDDRVPGYYGETIYGAGAITAASIPLTCLLVGNKISAGTAVANQDIVAIRSTTDADTYFGAGCELARMCYVALKVTGVNLYAAAVTESAGAAATATCTITGPATAAGTHIIRVDGVQIVTSIANGDSATTIASNISANANLIATLSCTASPSVGVVTFTRRNKGPRGNDGSLMQDKSQLPAGVTSTLAGGTAMTGGGFRFTGGTTPDDVTTFLTLEFPGQYDRSAYAHNDATNAVLISNQMTTKAGPLEGRLQHVVFGHNGTLAAATSIAQTSLNAQRCQFLHHLNSESHPSEIAAAMAALRSVTEQSDPDAAYDGAVLLGIAPQTQKADIPSHATMKSAINNSVSEMSTTTDGKAFVVRSITTHSLVAPGGAPDYRTLDTSDAVVPDYVRTSIGLVWTTEYKPANPRVQDDPDPTQKEAAAGVATPQRWNQRIIRVLRELERQTLIINVDSNLPSSGYDQSAKRIISMVPVVPAPNQHQVGVSVRQNTTA